MKVATLILAVLVSIAVGWLIAVFTASILGLSVVEKIHPFFIFSPLDYIIVTVVGVWLAWYLYCTWTER